MSPHAQLTEGPIGRTLATLSGPMLIGIFSIAIFNVVDTWFVSLLGGIELAAISFTFPVVMVVGSVTMGLGIGATSVVSRAIGAGRPEDVRRYTTDALMLALALVIVLSVVGWFTIDPLFRAMGASESTLPHIRSYMRVWYLGMVFLVVPMVGNSAIRATGDTRTPATIMVAAGLINALLDPILIFGIGPIPGMGLGGAAWATVAARAVALVLSMRILHFRERMIDWRWVGPAEGVRSWKAILAVGLPAAATNVVVPLSFGVVIGMVARHGEFAVAALGVGSRVEMMATMAVMAVGASLGPFAGQNWGAGRRDRLGRALTLAGRFSLGWGLLTWIAFATAGTLIARAFSPDPSTIDLIVVYLWLLPISHGLLGVQMVSAATFNAINRPLNAAALSLLKAPVLVLAMAWAGGQLFGIAGIFAGMALSNVVVGTLAHVWTRSLRRAGRSAPLVPLPVPESAPGECVRHCHLSLTSRNGNVTSWVGRNGSTSLVHGIT